jgi:hypothetical protein
VGRTLNPAPIGGHTGEVRYGYDARGRLLADTVYRGSTPIPITYLTDIHERDSLVTDALGAWRTRYEVARGFAERLVTPYSDSIALVKGISTGPGTSTRRGRAGGHRGARRPTAPFRLAPRGPRPDCFGPSGASQ